MVVDGGMVAAADNWNCQLESITLTSKDGKTSDLEHVFIRGSRVRFIIIPDMLKNAPMFKRLDARIKGKSASLGVGRGRAVAMRAKAEALDFNILLISIGFWLNKFILGFF
ncbi:hypothetical protein Droror1_Dr00000788 [Drosera rotundifolia]